MNTLPETGFLRIRQILGNPKAVPPVPAIIPVGRTAWYGGIKAGRYPAGVKLSPGVTVWRAEDIRKLIESKSA